VLLYKDHTNERTGWSNWSDLATRRVTQSHGRVTGGRAEACRPSALQVRASACQRRRWFAGFQYEAGSPGAVI
jgi:hypothetical protein